MGWAKLVHLLGVWGKKKAERRAGADGARERKRAKRFFASDADGATCDVDLFFYPQCGAFVIGGAELYALALASPRCTKVFLTSILREFPCDRFFPRSDLAALFDLEDVGEVQTEALVPFQFQTWTRRPGIELPVSADGLLEGRAHVYDVTPPPSTSPTKGKVHEEQKYLDLVREVIETGTQVIDRTLVGTRFVFGRDLRFSLRDGKLPLYTTKRVPVKTMLIELVWMLKGQTCSEILRRQGCNIWNDNGSRAFLDKYGFHDRRVGDLGPVYGFQWRHWGAKYIDADTSYAGQGIDQVQILLNKIRENNPSDRRMLISAWNVSDLAKMALPPCHYSMEWAVDAGRGELSCKVNMRSNDLGLGNPFNVAGYSCLVALVAHLTGYRPGELILSIGNAHVYLNHIEALQEQLTRTPGDFPTLKIREGITDIDQVSVDDFVISGYSPQGTLKMKMAV